VADLRSFEDDPSTRNVTTYQGTMVLVSGVLQVNVGGNIIPARWADPLVVVEGDPVLVEISSSRKGQGAAFVRCRLASRPRPGQGKVLTVPASSPTITVTGSDGTTYTATFVASYTPTVGDPVVLSWNASVPTVVGKVAATAAPPNTAPPVVAPPATQAGSTPFPASASDTFWPAGGWGTWAGGGSHVYQGNYGSGQVYGAWFYAGSTAQTAGKNITGIRFKLGARRAVGGSSTPVTLHLYAHSSPNKPGGDVARVAGPYDITVQPGQPITEYNLPLSFASALQNGGGIAIAGDPYAGVQGVLSQPESGLLTMDWSVY